MIRSLSGMCLASRYRVGAPVGRGGTSDVYEGVDESLDRPVAIKVLRNRAALARFEREARLLARLAHPNVVVMSDFGNAEGEPPFIVMERLHGDSLGVILARDHRLEAGRVAKLALQVLSALAAAHAQGVVHRDLKPDNVFVCAGEASVVKLLDFGIARPLEGATLEALTQSNALLGTVSFMAPEQVLGWPIDARTDLYGLGATMFYALSGRAPFRGTTVDVLTAIATASAPRLESVDAPLAAIVERAMQRDPNARFASANEMSSAIANYLAGAQPSASPWRGSLGPWIFASTAVVAVATSIAAAFVIRRNESVSAPAPIASVASAAPSASIMLPQPSITAAPSTSVVLAIPSVTSNTKPSRPKCTMNATLAVKGDITNAQIQPELDAAALQFYDCYVRHYASPPYPDGALTLHFDIANQRAGHAHVTKTDFSNRSFETCVFRVLASKVISAAAPEDTADVFYTLDFKNVR